MRDSTSADACSIGLATERTVPEPPGYASMRGPLTQSYTATTYVTASSTSALSEKVVR